jgi:outer membrane murein-binding lipoprotein Lpp
MPRVKNRIANLALASALVLGGLSLSGCATEKYVDEHIAVVNSRVDAVDAKASDAIQRADAAAAAAQAAAADARTANQRLDELTPRVQTLEQRPAKRPRN